jgi:hypothetical protein
MVKKELASADIIAIIGAGAKFNLQRLKFGDLEIQFGAYQPEPEANIPGPGASKPDLGVNQVFPEESQRMLRDRIAQLQIENPLLAEQMIADGDLVDDNEDIDGDEEA